MLSVWFLLVTILVFAIVGFVCVDLCVLILNLIARLMTRKRRNASRSSSLPTKLQFPQSEGIVPKDEGRRLSRIKSSKTKKSKKAKRSAKKDKHKEIVFPSQVPRQTEANFANVALLPIAISPVELSGNERQQASSSTADQSMGLDGIDQANKALTESCIAPISNLNNAKSHNPTLSEVMNDQNLNSKTSLEDGRIPKLSLFDPSYNLFDINSK